MNESIHRSVPLVTATTLTVAMLLGTAACGSGQNQEPSAENFCATLTQNADKLRNSTAQLRNLAESSGAERSVSDMAAAAKSFIDLSNLYDELAQVAPPEVKADAERVRTTFGNLTQGANVDTTELAASAREALDSLRTSGELQRLRDYAQQQCGVTIG